jgi:hypothetical protein
LYLYLSIGVSVFVKLGAKIQQKKEIVIEKGKNMGKGRNNSCFFTLLFAISDK